MPYRRRGRTYRRTRARRAYGRRRNRTAYGAFRTARVSRSAVAYRPMGMQRRVKMVYNTTTTLALTSNSYVYHAFSANSLNDPDVTGTGHQPYGYDQMGLFFGRYCVTYSTIKVIFSATDTGADSLSPWCAGVLTYDNATLPVPAVSTDLQDYPRMRWKQGYGIDTFAATPTVRNSCTPRKWLHIPRGLELCDQSLTAPLGSNPTAQMYYHVAVWQGPVAETYDAPIACNIRLTYYATFFDPFILSQS